MNEALNLGLHAPVSKLHFTQLVSAHDGHFAWVVVDFRDPVIRQGAPLGFIRLVEFRVLFN